MKHLSLLLLVSCIYCSSFAQGHGAEATLDNLNFSKGSEDPTVYFINADSSLTVQVKFGGRKVTILPHDVSKAIDCSPFPLVGGYKIWVVDNKGTKALVADVDVPKDQGIQYVTGNKQYLAIIEYDNKSQMWGLRLKDRNERPKPVQHTDSTKQKNQ